MKEIRTYEGRSLLALNRYPGGSWGPSGGGSRGSRGSRRWAPLEAMGGMGDLAARRRRGEGGQSPSTGVQG